MMTGTIGQNIKRLRRERDRRAERLRDDRGKISYKSVSYYHERRYYPRGKTAHYLSCDLYVGGYLHSQRKP